MRRLATLCLVLAGLLGGGCSAAVGWWMPPAKPTRDIALAREVLAVRVGVDAVLVDVSYDLAFLEGRRRLALVFPLGGDAPGEDFAVTAEGRAVDVMAATRRLWLTPLAVLTTYRFEVPSAWWRRDDGGALHVAYRQAARETFTYLLAPARNWAGGIRELTITVDDPLGRVRNADVEGDAWPPGSPLTWRFHDLAPRGGLTLWLRPAPDA